MYLLVTGLVGFSSSRCPVCGCQRERVCVPTGVVYRNSSVRGRCSQHAAGRSQSRIVSRSMVEGGSVIAPCATHPSFSPSGRGSPSAGLRDLRRVGNSSYLRTSGVGDSPEHSRWWIPFAAPCWIRTLARVIHTYIPR